MFPVAILVATIAMVLGVGGALIFSPIFIILFPILGVPTLSPADAFGAALLTEVFGFTSGLIGYGRHKLIDYKTAGALLAISIPSAVIGTVLKRQIGNEDILNFIFGVGLLLLAIYIFSSVKKDNHGPPKPSYNSPKRKIVDSDQNEYEYLVCNQNQGKLLTGAGGFVTGLISVGVGETVVSTLRVRCGLPMKVATGTSVLVVTVTVLSSALTDIALIGLEKIPWELVLFTIPGVLIGGQIGPKLASKISSETAEKLIIAIFLLIGVIMLSKALCI
jgi:uncharacterized membrane protein YfcA